MTLLKPGKLQELIEQIEHTKLDIVALQEVRWSGNGIINKKDFTLYFSGTDKSKGQAGTGFLVSKKLQNDIIDFKHFNERMCKLRIKCKHNNITLINIYAPTEDKAIDVKEQFYKELESLINQVPRSDTLIILGDFNAQLGKEAIYRKVSGKHTIHERTNGNGELLCHLAMINDLIIMSTQFEHKKIHKGTWTSPDQKIINQIDHVLINSKKKDVIEDVRSMRGPNIDSDHFLVKVIMSQKLPAIYKKKTVQTTKWNKINLQNTTKIKEYRETLVENLKGLPDSQDINNKWEGIKKAINEAADKVIGKQKKIQRNEWWDEDCKKIIAEKNEARMRAIKIKTRASQELYNLKRKTANKICRSKKKKWLNEKLIKIKENYKKNESRKFFGEVKNFKQQQTVMPVMCKNADGNMLTQTADVLNRWREHFQTIFNYNFNEEIRLQDLETDSDGQLQISPPNFNEICHIINNLKTNKAPGSDNIPPELIKYGGRMLKQKIYNLITDIWREERLPDQWNEGVICPIFKKGDRLNCKNYRPITLLNITYKIYAILLNQRLTHIIEDKLDDYQMGFRANRSTIDNIFIIRQIFEKCHEHNIELFNMFIDFSNAFDSVCRNKLIECLSYYKVPKKLICLIALTLINTTAKIKVNNNVSEEFKIQCGVKQGDPLSATLFCLVIDFILKKLDLRGNISTKLKQCTAYADDIIITARTKSAMIETFNNLKEQSMQFGLVINENKTKFLKCSNKDEVLKDLNINNMKFQQVSNFQYLGSIVNSNNTIEEEVKKRIIQGNKAYYANLSLFKSKLI